MIINRIDSCNLLRDALRGPGQAMRWTRGSEIPIKELAGWFLAEAADLLAR
jgi:hypothetical protein